MLRHADKVFAIALLFGSTGFAQPAESVYKNIVQLKGTPADQLMPAMQFISASLGVQCDFCHVAGKMDADDKGPKKTAREMMAMQAAINKDAFQGRLQVTCFSCHRGAQHPVNSPPVLDSDAPARPAAPMAPASGAAAITATRLSKST